MNRRRSPSRRTFLQAASAQLRRETGDRYVYQPTMLVKSETARGCEER